MSLKGETAADAEIANWCFLVGYLCFILMALMTGTLVVQ